MSDKPCPQCGYCPTCGRGPVPHNTYYPPTFAPWWQTTWNPTGVIYTSSNTTYVSEENG